MGAVRLVPGGCSAAGLDDYAVKMKRRRNFLRLFLTRFAKGFSLVAKPGRFLGEKGFVSIKFRRISPEMDKEMSRKVLVNYKISVGDWLIKRGIYVTMKKHTRERSVGHDR